ncbi:MAG: MaoC family dehydratase [Acidobacteriota bacterium]
MRIQKLIARNYATDHTNKIHSDETARTYGFTGALVPGVAVYSYMIEPVVAEFGDDWLSRGSASVKFLKPVYDGSEVTVEARVKDDSVSFDIQVLDVAGTLCAVGEASLREPASTLASCDYPILALPLTDARREPSAEAVPQGDILGSLEAAFDPERLGADFGRTVRRPALLLALANDLVAGNVALGPWIHTASSVQHFGLLDEGEPFSMRGRIEESGKKRGHDYITIDVGLFGASDRPIARIHHSALIRLRESTTSAT